jgi:membrane protease subunit HflC
MGKKLGPILVIIVVFLIGMRSTFFIVDETEQALLIQLGKPVGGILEPGFHVKLPFVQEALKFEKRLMDYDAAAAEILTSDKKNLIVDNYAKWRIVDPLRFYQTVRNYQGALLRLDDVIYAELRVELGRHEMIEIIADKRTEIMESVTKRADEKARENGITVLDVRIKRTDLPPENERAVYGRMKAERERQAKRYRSEGQEEALKIRAEAERLRTVILAVAYRKAQQFRGQGDAESIRIYAEAFEQDPEFFNFHRSLEAYRNSLSKNTTIILDPKDDFLRFLKESGADLPAPALEAPVRFPDPPERSAVDEEIIEKGEIPIDPSAIEDIEIPEQNLMPPVSGDPNAATPTQPSDPS